MFQGLYSFLPRDDTDHIFKLFVCWDLFKKKYISRQVGLPLNQKNK